MPMKLILVVGGAGYIGSHMVLLLQKAGFTPIVLDNLSTGHQNAVLNAKLIIGDITDTALLEKLFHEFNFLAVMHFASFIQVGESVINPAKYYQNNLSATLNLLNNMLKARINNFIFSSTAAIYGEPQYTPIDEKHPVAPINPYGRSKQMIEQILEDFSKAYDFRFASLRYFNAAGADPSGRLCERHNPETHLIPSILRTLTKETETITIYGNDYPAPDGTCIRDYVHVMDLCNAHLLVLKALCDGHKKCIYNLGTGNGYSVKQVIDTVSRVTKKNIPIVYGQRRAGDPAILVADPTLAMHELNWKPQYSELEIIIQHAALQQN